MFEVTGRFILHRDAPHLVLTDVPVALQQMHIHATDAPADASLDTLTGHEPRLGDWNVASADGEQPLNGVLYPLSGLGENGQRLAREQVERARSRPKEQGAHTIRFDEKGALLNWVITPKALLNNRR